MTNPLVGIRLKALRDDRGLSQDDIAKVLEFNDRQTVSAIEKGDRRAKPEELEKLIEEYALDFDYFTDPFRLVGEGAFSWRQSDCAPAALEAYQKRAGRWLAAFRALTELGDRPGPSERRSLRLWEQSTFEQACAEGERLTVDCNMGDVPALKLPSVMENEYGIIVLMVDMPEGISGAACRLPELDAVLVNRQETCGRRNFDLAHEFFHILTWDKMPPKPVEVARSNGGDRIEKLANAFASALLMPKRLLERFGEWQILGTSERAQRMRAVADHFQVSIAALHWRLVSLRMLNRTAEILDCGVSMHDRDGPALALFSRVFMSAVAKAIEEGEISVARLAKLLDVSRDKLRDLFTVHGVQVPVTV